MRTKFPFELQIDDDKFNLIYKDPNKKQSDEFLNDFKALKADISLYDQTKREIESLIEKKELKKELVKELDKNEKQSLVKEILSLLDQIAHKQKILNAFEKKSVDIEAVALKRFKLCVFGDDKDRLIDVIEKNGLSYHQIINAIDNAVAKEREKK